MEMWCISPRVTQLLPPAEGDLCGQLVAELPAVPLQGFRSVPGALAWPVALEEPSADAGGYKPHVEGSCPLGGVLTLAGGLVAELGWVQGCSAGPGGDGNGGGTAELLHGLRFPCRRTASFTSRPSGSSSCPWRGRGWSHLTGTAHGGGFGSVGGFFISPERRWPWESWSELVAVETFCSLKEELSPSRAVKEGGDAEGLGNQLISCCRNQEPSVLQKIKELWL